MKIQMAMVLILMMKTMMVVMMMTKCVGSKTGRRGWGRVVLCWTCLTKTGATALLLYAEAGDDHHDDNDDGGGDGSSAMTTWIA